MTPYSIAYQKYWCRGKLFSCPNPAQLGVRAVRGRDVSCGELVWRRFAGVLWPTPRPHPRKTSNTKHFGRRRRRKHRVAPDSAGRTAALPTGTGRESELSLIAGLAKPCIPGSQRYRPDKL